MYPNLFLLKRHIMCLNWAPNESNWAPNGSIILQVELYMVLDPLVDKAGAVRLGEQLRHYLLDKSIRAENMLSST